MIYAWLVRPSLSVCPDDQTVQDAGPRRLPTDRAGLLPQPQGNGGYSGHLPSSPLPLTLTFSLSPCCPPPPSSPPSPPKQPLKESRKQPILRLYGSAVKGDGVRHNIPSRPTPAEALLACHYTALWRFISEAVARVATLPLIIRVPHHCHRVVLHCRATPEPAETSCHLSVRLSVYIYPSVYLSIYLSTYLSTYPSSIHLIVDLPVCLSGPCL